METSRAARGDMQKESDPVSFPTRGAALRIASPPWCIALVSVALACVVPLAPALRSGKVLSAADGVLDSYLFAEARPASYARSNRLLTDSYRQFDPWRALTTRELKAGRLPFWNPYAYAGSPLLGNAQSAVFDPLALPYLVVDRVSHGTVWVALLRMLVAGAGALMLARRLGAGPEGGALAGILYACGGFTIAWLLSPHTSSSAWLPWALLATENLVAAPSPGRILALAIPLSLSVLGGHVEVAFFTALASCTYAALRQFQYSRLVGPGWTRIVGAMAAAGALCLALSAVQVLPFLEALDESVTAASRADLVRSASIARDTHPERLLTQVFPYLQGRPLRDEPGFWTPGTGFNDQVATYGSVLGLLLAGAVLLGAGRSAPAVALGTLGLGAFAYHVGIPPLRWMGQQLPIVRLTPAERVAPVALCALAVLAGLGLERVREYGPRSRLARAVPRTCTIAGAAATLVGVALFVEPGAAAAVIRRVIESTALRALLGAQAGRVLGGLEGALPVMGLRYLAVWGVLTMASGWVCRRLFTTPGPEARRTAVIVAALDVIGLGFGFNPALPGERVFPETSALREVAQAATDGRVLSLDEGLPANVATYYQLADVLGYDALDRRRHRALLELAGPFGRISAFPHADSWVHDLLGVRVVASRTARTEGDLTGASAVGKGLLMRNPGALPLMFTPQSVTPVAGLEEAAAALRRPGFDPAAVAVVETRSAVRGAVLSGPVQRNRPALGRLEIRLDVAVAGVVVISEGYDRGWSAWIDGTPAPVFPAYVALMAVPVPAGQHVLQLRFRPMTWTMALWFLAAGCLAVAVIVIGEARARLRRP